MRGKGAMYVALFVFLGFQLVCFRDKIFEVNLLKKQNNTSHKIVQEGGNVRGNCKKNSEI